MKFRVFSKGLALLAVVVFGFYGCSAGGGNDTGRLSMSLTDKPTHDYSEVWVTIQDIYVHMEGDAEGSWTKVLDVNKTLNLLTLANGLRYELGMVDLAPGHYTQMRLMVGAMNSEDPAKPANYIVDMAGHDHALKIPSGVQSGIKLVQGFDINANSTTELIFDFDVAASIVAAGNSGKYILRPTIHQIDDTQTRTIIKGFVKDANGAGIEGADVALQVYTPRTAGQDFKAEISRYASTVTDATGAYMFWFLNIPEAKTFNAVATQWNSTNPYYSPAWDQIAGAVNGNVYPVDFALAVPAEVGTLELKAVVNDTDTTKVPDETLFVTLSIRQATSLPGTPMVEVMSKTIVAYDDEWLLTEITPVKVDLPVLASPGVYTIVASFEGRPSIEQTIAITKIGPNQLTFTFPVPTP
ncbi:MAG TPA: DUF4382 domain-containing protein [Acidobacteriota bacterium]|nr:DUF4382 domain-containing protein [Acidobacteriota bacterium]